MFNANKEQIKLYMLKLVDGGDRELVAKTTETFGVSKSSAYNYLKEMCDDGIIEKTDGIPSYRMLSHSVSFSYVNDGTLGEDRIFNRDIQPLLNSFDSNVFSVWRYSFTEMMNNAIEHSLAKNIHVKVITDALNTRIVISDDGIGIFRNIQNYMSMEKGQTLALDECVPLLFAGKFTTAKSLHSGEGIFFTSHLMDKFVICSDNIFFSRDSFNDIQDSDMTAKTGTTVTMWLNNQSKKTTREVFDRFSDVDEGFIRTHIPIVHVFSNGSPISRSEARRLGELIMGFKEITLDFTNVEEVGQAFCHELFIVWQTRNPDVMLVVCNADEAVDRMIRRVKNTK